MNTFTQLRVTSSTGTRWAFPQQLRKYVSLAHAQDQRFGGCACENGHFGCAAWDAGPCSDELLGQYADEAAAYLWRSNPYYRIIARRDPEAARDYAERYGSGESFGSVDQDMVVQVLAERE